MLREEHRLLREALREFASSRLAPNAAVLGLPQRAVAVVGKHGDTNGELVILAEDHLYGHAMTSAPLIANGVVAYKDQDAGGNDYWYVPAVNLATFCDSQGFTAWAFDTENGSPFETTPVAATAWDNLRNYGTGERSQSGGYYDVTAGADKYLSIRYVDLRLPNELGS